MVVVIHKNYNLWGKLLVLPWNVCNFGSGDKKLALFKPLENRIEMRILCTNTTIKPFTSVKMLEIKIKCTALQKRKTQFVFAFKNHLLLLAAVN